LDMTGDREVLAERVPDEAVVGENATQVGMTFEHDAVKVEGLALEPVHSGPDIDQRGQDGEFVVSQVATYAQAPIMSDGQQMQYDGKALRMGIVLGWERGRPPGGVVDPAKIDTDLETGIGIVAQCCAGIGPVLGGHDERELIAFLHERHGVTERSLQVFYYRC